MVMMAAVAVATTVAAATTAMANVVRERSEAGPAVAEETGKARASAAAMELGSPEGPDSHRRQSPR